MQNIALIIENSFIDFIEYGFEGWNSNIDVVQAIYQTKV